MAQQNINIGAAANDGTGDNLRAAAGKMNSNFSELYLGMRLASGAKKAIIDCFGDSISAHSSGGGLGQVFRSAAYYWAAGLNIQLRGNYGVGGTSSSHVLSNQLPIFQAAIAGGTALPDIAVLQTYSNDQVTAANAATFAQTSMTFAATLLGMGVPFVILGSAVPKSAGGPQSGRMAINAILRRFADTTPGVIFFDWFSDAVDPNTAAAAIGSPWNSALGGYSGDTVHPGGNASFYAGRTMAAILSPIVGRVNPRTMSNIRYANTSADTRWDSATGPEGNFQGTGGQLNGVDNTGVAGSAASANNRWQITTPAGVTVTPSIVVDDTGIRKQRMVLSGTPTADGVILLRHNVNYQPMNSALFERQGILDFTDVAGIAEFLAMALDGPIASPTTTGVFPTHSGRWFIRDIHPLVPYSSGGARDWDVRLSVRNGTPVSGTVDVSRCYVYQVGL